MTVGEVHVIVDAFGRLAENFTVAGYDGIELHGAHGCLIAQFLTPSFNAGPTHTAGTCSSVACGS
jgi:2,4-dienoyl-CoA reductase-like NADH-dependent reductase (Old Yellow Enzyme family)